MGQTKPQQVWLDAVTDTSSTAVYTVGTRRYEDGNEYTYVLAGTSGITAYYAAYYSGSTANYVIDPVPSYSTVAATLFAGVPQTAIGSSAYGWMLTRGAGSVFAYTSCAAGVPLYQGLTAGILDDAATNTAIARVTLIAAGGGSASAARTCWLF